MRIEKVSIENYRCLHRLDLEVDDLTVLIGANSTGKSSVLRALRWFFEGGELEPEDVCGMRPEAAVSVSVTFGDLTPEDRETLAPCGVGDSATFRRSWSVENGGKLTGRAIAYPPFEEVRKHEKAANAATIAAATAILVSTKPPRSGLWACGSNTASCHHPIDRSIRSINSADPAYTAASCRLGSVKWDQAGYVVRTVDPFVTI